MEVKPPAPGTPLHEVNFELNLDIIDAHLERVLKIDTDIGKYQYLRHLQIDEPQQYWSLVVRHAARMLPYIYTPTVGKACEEYSQLPVREVGLFLSYPQHKGKIKEMLLQAQKDKGADVRVIVVTDGERILGLGDQGAGGMGISEGKIQLYTACAGVPPENCLPVCLDVGTNRQSLLDDESYRGVKSKRLSTIDRPAYDAFMDEFMTAVRSFDHISLQFEDFGNTTAFDHLANYADKQCCFNDDIQGTACVTLAGLVSALRVTGVPLSEQRILFLGAGEAGTGIGDLITMYLAKHTSMPLEEARKRCSYMDSSGLVCASRLENTDKGSRPLAHHKQKYAHDTPFCSTFLEAVKQVKPTCIIGVSTVYKAFNEEVIRAMCDINERPIIFPLSNPTSKAECTFQECMDWSNGTAVFASGSPFDPLPVRGRTITPAQANNAYVFPAVGLAAVATKSTRIDDQVFLVAAEVLARLSTVDQLANGLLFPPFAEITTISLKIAAEVASYMIEKGYAETPTDLPKDGDMKAWLRPHMWKHVRHLTGMSSL